MPPPPPSEPTPPKEMAARAARDLGTPHARATRLLSGNDCVAARHATNKGAIDGLVRRLDDYKAAHDTFALLVREAAERVGESVDVKTFAELAAEGGKPKAKGRGKPATPEPEPEPDDDLSDDELDRLTAPAPAPESTEPKPDGDRTSEGPAGEGEHRGEGPLGKFFSRRGDG